MNAIEVSDLTFNYKRAEASRPLIHISSWQVPESTHLFIHGESGSGKTTLLNLICGLLTPQKGTISLLNQPFSQMTSQQRDRFRAQHIGVVFQEFNLIPFLTVLENIDLAVSFAKRETDLTRNVKARAAEIFERLQLDQHLLVKRADELSVGQRQRVSIARALINQPEIVIADEPTSALDAANRDEFMRLLMETAAKCTVLFVSHDLALQKYFSQSLAMTTLLARQKDAL